MKDLKKEIIETVNRIDDSWLLGVICRFIQGVTEGTEYEYIRQDNTQE